MRGGGEQRTVACDDASHATCSIGLVCDSIIVLRKIVSTHPLSIHQTLSHHARHQAIILRFFFFGPACLLFRFSSRAAFCACAIRFFLFASPSPCVPPPGRAAPIFGIGPGDLAGSCAGFAALPLAPLAWPSRPCRLLPPAALLLASAAEEEAEGTAGIVFECFRNLLQRSHPCYGYADRSAGERGSRGSACTVAKPSTPNGRPVSTTLTDRDAKAYSTTASFSSTETEQVE